MITTPTTTVSDRVWRVSDLKLMPPGYRYEILDGVLYMVAMPAWPHALVVDNLKDIVGPWVRKRKLGRLLGAQTGVYRSEVNYVDPDLVFLRPDQYPPAGQRPTSAALGIEVLSPSNLRTPRDQREDLLRQARVEEVWYVDFEARTLEVRRIGDSGYETAAHFRGADTVRSGRLPGLAFPLAALWEDMS